jgi:hypothetical protein
MCSFDMHSRARFVCALLLIILGAALTVQAFQTVIPPTRKSVSPPSRQPPHDEASQPEPQ